MDPDAQFAYTEPMTEAEVESHLHSVGHGVLGLADGGESYAIPLYHHYEDGTFFFRLGATPGNQKGSYIEATDAATYVVYAAESTDDPPEQRGWSIIARGPIDRVPEDHPDYDVAAINERFAPIRLFDEAHDEVTLTLYELRPEHVSGRQN